MPYKELLGRRNFWCNSCGQIFNVDTHFRSFNDKKDAIDLFEERYVLYKEAYAGHIYPRFFSAFYFLKNRYAGEPDEFAICYHCGNDNFSMQNNKVIIKFIKLFISMMERLLSFFMPCYPYWMLCLLKRKTGYG